MLGISRRVFLGAVAAGTATAQVNREPARFVVLDLGCVLAESLAGFREQAGDLRDGDTEVVIVPGVGSWPAEDVDFFLRRGATVLVERCWGVPISQRTYSPYVEYFWPVRVKIREFAPVWLEPAPGDEVIATYAGKAVGLRRRVGDGTLVTLGSPMGPVFRTQDPDARLWLEAFFAHAR